MEERINPPATGSKWKHLNGTTSVVLMITNSDGTRGDHPPTVVYADVGTGQPYSEPVASFYNERREVWGPKRAPAATKLAEAVLRQNDLDTAHAMVELLADDSARLSALENLIMRNGYHLDCQRNKFTLATHGASERQCFPSLRMAIDDAEGTH